MSDLRSKIIRLAHANPELRPHLLPILTSAVRVAGRLPLPDLEKGDTMKGAKAYMSLLRTQILSGSEPDSPAREALIDEAKRNVSNAALFFRSNRGVEKYYRDELKALKELMSMPKQ